MSPFDDERLAEARAFITSLFGEPFEDHWWLSKKATKSPTTGLPVTGWCIRIEGSDLPLISVYWEDITPDDPSHTLR
jgi:hypothetical protein